MANTREVYQHIVSEDGFDEAFVLKNQALPFAEYLLGQLEARGMRRMDLIEALGIDRVYGYQLLNGTRRMSRELLVRTALFLQMDVEGAQRLLRMGGAACLYARDRQDARVIFAMAKRMPYPRACRFIWQEGG
ncbi:MAG: helix-turn-helix domain-containing protein [Clostridiales bacterium]|nr:helix-turn-helix domain-containing protein [Clostridiales bacterium]MDO4350457.1 helix-turn-helix transcriptional regulator [Eubacteriales bacterium]MDY4007327.1 helix-turn-helix transcriptional regulator [Candidatus Limiplasma sp.]